MNRKKWLKLVLVLGKLVIHAALTAALTYVGYVSGGQRGQEGWAIAAVILITSGVVICDRFFSNTEETP